MKIEQIIAHIKECIKLNYATEYTPTFNWEEWKEILKALEERKQ